jgi:hypothetical protein
MMMQYLGLGIGHMDPAEFSRDGDDILAVPEPAMSWQKQKIPTGWQEACKRQMMTQWVHRHEQIGRNLGGIS